MPIATCPKCGKPHERGPLMQRFCSARCLVEDAADARRRDADIKRLGAVPPRVLFPEDEPTFIPSEDSVHSDLGYRPAR